MFQTELSTVSLLSPFKHPLLLAIIAMVLIITSIDLTTSSDHHFNLDLGCLVVTINRSLCEILLLDDLWIQLRVIFYYKFYGQILLGNLVTKAELLVGGSESRCSNTKLKGTRVENRLTVHQIQFLKVKNSCIYLRFGHACSKMA